MTLLTLSMPWPFIVVIFPFSLLVFYIMAEQVRARLASFESWNQYCSATTVRSIWMYAASATAIVLAPTNNSYLTLLFSMFLFRMSLIDTLTGLLPREMTLSCLVAGLIAALTTPEVLSHPLSAAFAVLLFGGWRFVASKWTSSEAIGLGDVWLAGSICAWLGFSLGLNALLTGVVLFVLWQLSLRRISEGGPLGPWLCFGALITAIINLYQPRVTW